MLTPGEVHVWRVRLAPASQDQAHAALHAILRAHTAAPLDFARRERGKPYLPHSPALKFNLSHSHGMALVGVALDVEIGVDIERLRPLAEHQAIAERFFPPSEARALAAAPEREREREFFRRWTRIEAMLKATGEGLYGAGSELGGEWTVQEVDAGEGFAAAVAAARAGMTVHTHDFVWG